MTTANKTFDCVRMKRDAQERLSAEYEARRAEFASYAEFLQAAVTESEWTAAIWAGLQRAAAAPADRPNGGPATAFRRGP